MYPEKSSGPLTRGTLFKGPLCWKGQHEYRAFSIGEDPLQAEYSFKGIYPHLASARNTPFVKDIFKEAVILFWKDNQDANWYEEIWPSPRSDSAVTHKPLTCTELFRLGAYVKFNSPSILWPCYFAVWTRIEKSECKMGMICSTRISYKGSLMDLGFVHCIYSWFVAEPSCVQRRIAPRHCSRQLLQALHRKDGQVHNGWRWFCQLDRPCVT